MVMQRPERMAIDGETIEKIREVREFVDAHASEERRQSLADTYGDTVPLPNRSVHFALYMHEMATALREIVAAQEAANAPRKRGRPRKDAPEPTSQDASMDLPTGSEDR